MRSISIFDNPGKMSNFGMPPGNYITNRTYAKVHAVGAIHELPLRENKGFGYCLRKS